MIYLNMCFCNIPYSSHPLFCDEFQAIKPTIILRYCISPNLKLGIGNDVAPTRCHMFIVMPCMSICKYNTNMYKENVIC